MATEVVKETNAGLIMLLACVGKLFVGTLPGIIEFCNVVILRNIRVHADCKTC